MSTDPPAPVAIPDASGGRLWKDKKGGVFPPGYVRRVLDETDSTMAEARRIAPEVSDPCWILARRQTAGQGRRGRPWVMPEGNFAATLVLPRPGPALQAAQRSFVAACALAQALVAAGAGAEKVQLKWPNDVLLGGRKVAGILLEAITAPGRAEPSHLAIGIGVNLAEAPAPAILEAGAIRPVALSEVCSAPDPMAFLDLLADAFAEEERIFLQETFAGTRRRWLARAARLGEVVTARTQRETLSGIFADVDNDGQLVLETPEGRVRIPAADVYFQT